MAVIRLYGLEVALTSGNEPHSKSDADLAWHRSVVSSLPSGYSGEAVRQTRADGVWVELLYGPGTETHCAFAVSPDGKHVESRSLPSVPHDDLLTLFAEPVMRTVFRRRDMLSLHGAALESGGKGIILLGRKGAGKSTLAAAMVEAGWNLVTDDLARVCERDGEWVIEPGFAQLKMTPDTAQALGYDLAVLPRRWSSPEAVDDPLVNKYIRKLDAPKHAVPLSALYILSPATADEPAPLSASLQPAERVRAVIEHISDDPAAPGTPASPKMLQRAFAMLGKAQARSLALPRRYNALPDAARLIERELAGA